VYSSLVSSVGVVRIVYILGGGSTRVTHIYRRYSVPVRVSEDFTNTVV